MKVVFLTHEYPPIIFGGIGPFVKNLAAPLSEQGVKVTVISGFPTIHPEKPIKEAEGNVSILRFPYPNIPPRHTFFQLANLKLLCSTIREENPDIIHGQSWSSYPTLLKMKNEFPSIITFHASPKMEKNTSIGSLFQGGSLMDLWTYVIGYYPMSYLSKHELDLSKISIAVSKTVKSELIDEFGSRYSYKIRSIYNGLNLEKIDSEYNSPEGIEESDEVILFAGRLFWRKGVLDLTKLAYILQKEGSKLRILVHGVGPLFHRLQSEIRFLGLKNIKLEGFTTREKLMKNMRLCRFIIVPSKYEACPMSLLEGMCLGKIPLMLKRPFSMELSRNGEYGVISDSIDSLARKLSTLKNLDLNIFSKKVKSFARREFDARKTAQEYLEVYKEFS